ncbi:hypothetical protein [Streptomyces marincola]|uniref:hypothetical protein n=1 Tax=Streptomyces marincola TaxID=2878388 RepID=UPI001CF2E320|nr:hypothetical protein [Streptomyces marincola]UCM91605.1 hypothetical protein LC193_28660 [Streptomyces marincola]
MRKGIRAAVPTAVVALVLAGCGGDSDGGPFSGLPETPDSEGSEVRLPEGGADGGAPANEQIQGAWVLVGEGADPPYTTNISFIMDEVHFVESTSVEGDVCQGTVSEGVITVECVVSGEMRWPDTRATVALDGEQLVVTWESGIVQTYRASH